jgi:hypothetical protein
VGLLTSELSVTVCPYSSKNLRSSGIVAPSFSSNPTSIFCCGSPEITLASKKNKNINKMEHLPENLFNKNNKYIFYEAL